MILNCTQIKIMVEFLFLNQADEGGVPRKHISKPRLYLPYQSCAEVGKMLTLKKIFLRGRVMAEFFNLGLAPKVRLPSDSENDRQSLIQQGQKSDNLRIYFLFHTSRHKTNKLGQEPGTSFDDHFPSHSVTLLLAPV